VLIFHRRSRWPTTFLSHIFFFGGGGYPGWGIWPENWTRSRFFNHASTHQVCIIVHKLSCWQTNKQTNKEILLKTSTSFRYATPVENKVGCLKIPTQCSCPNRLRTRRCSRNGPTTSNPLAVAWQRRCLEQLPSAAATTGTVASSWSRRWRSNSRWCNYGHHLPV